MVRAALLRIVDGLLGGLTADDAAAPHHKRYTTCMSVTSGRWRQNSRSPSSLVHALVNTLYCRRASVRRRSRRLDLASMMRPMSVTLCAKGDARERVGAAGGGT